MSAQTIIFGAGKKGTEIYNKFFGSEKNVVFYDNNRLKWGTEIGSTKVIILEEFIKLISDPSNKIILTTENETAIPFLKDASPACKVIRYENGEETEIYIASAGEFKYDNSIELGTANLKNYEKYAEMLKSKAEKCQQNSGGVPLSAYNHAMEYIEFKRNHIALPEILSLEFTNNCNLKCPNCPNSTIGFHKGFMSDEVFEASLRYIPPYPGGVVAVHGFGEPLMHPKIIEYMERMTEIGLNPEISTNGVLLDKQMSSEIMRVLSRTSRSVFYISFHTYKSVEAWYRIINEFSPIPESMEFFGQVLEHNKDEVHKWLKDFGIDKPEEHKNIRHITSHSWAGNVENRRKEYSDLEVENRKRNCCFLRNRWVSVKWDGTLRSCCMDVNIDNACGNIFDFKNAKQNPHGFNLCKYCDPDWVSNFQ